MDTYLGVHKTERQAHGYGKQPYEDDFQSDSPTCLITAESHRIAQRQVPVHGYCAQVHNAGRTEEDVQANPDQAVFRMKWKISC